MLLHRFEELSPSLDEGGTWSCLWIDYAAQAGLYLNDRPLPSCFFFLFLWPDIRINNFKDIIKFRLKILIWVCIFAFRKSLSVIYNAYLLSKWSEHPDLIGFARLDCKIAQLGPDPLIINSALPYHDQLFILPAFVSLFSDASQVEQPLVIHELYL